VGDVTEPSARSTVAAPAIGATRRVAEERAGSVATAGGSRGRRRRLVAHPQHAGVDELSERPVLGRRGRDLSAPGGAQVQEPTARERHAERPGGLIDDTLHHNLVGIISFSRAHVRIAVPQGRRSSEPGSVCERAFVADVARRVPRSQRASRNAGHSTGDLDDDHRAFLVDDANLSPVRPFGVSFGRR
jgi:hypothetical protein